MIPIFESPDQITTAHLILMSGDPGSYSIMTVDDKFIVSEEGASHHIFAESILTEQIQQNEKESDEEYYDRISELAFDLVIDAKDTGRVWIHQNVLSLWDIDDDSMSYKSLGSYDSNTIDINHLTDILNMTGKELGIKININDWQVDVGYDDSGMSVLKTFSELNSKINTGDEWQRRKEEHRKSPMKKEKVDYKPMKKSLPLDWRQAMNSSESYIKQFNKMIPLFETENNIIKKISDFNYVTSFFSKYYPSKVIKDIPVYIISEDDWPEGKGKQTENDNNGGIRIHEDQISIDSNIGWLIHEVGHVLYLNGEKKPYIVSKEDFNGYPNEDNEQTPMWYQFKYMIENGLTEDGVIELEKKSYSDCKGGGTLWSVYKDKFFRRYYKEMKKVLKK